MDGIVVGGGHNGLVAAAYLARAGLKILVLERRDRVGGALDGVELSPGLRVPAVAHTVGRLRPSVVRDLGLARHGLRLIRPDVRVFAPEPEGRSLTLWADPIRTADEIRPWSATDAFAYPVFDRKVRALASFIAYLQAATPPDLRSPTLSDALGGLKLARAYRGLGPRAAREFLRVMPMAVADFVGEVFETDAVRGVLAARGVYCAAMGPWSAGTACVFLSDSSGNDGGASGQTTFAQGGPGGLADALAEAARTFGADIRTGADVTAILTRDGKVTGVVLAGGEEIPAQVVLSNLDPKRTLLGLVDPEAIGPTMVWRTRNVRMPGVVAKVNLALEGLPEFTALDGSEGHERLAGRILIAPGIDHLERAYDDSKYGRTSTEPFLEATIPTLGDPGSGPPSIHAMSVLVQYAPYHRAEGDWDADRDALGDLVMKHLETYAPGLTGRVIERQVLTPLDLERDYGLTEGHPLHGEPGLDQFFAWRPLLGHARYRLGGIHGLYLCGSGAHPGGGVTGAPGANAAREVLADRKRGT